METTCKQHAKLLSLRCFCLLLLANCLTLNAAPPSQYSFLQNHNRCTRSKCALLCKHFLLLTLSKFLSKEFLAGNSLIKKSDKNSSEIQEIIAKQSITQ